MAIMGVVTSKRGVVTSKRVDREWATFAWLSVTVKRGAATVIPRKIIKTNWDRVFGELLAEVDSGLENSVVRRVSISKNENFIDPVHEVEVSAPLSICSIFDCRFVCFYLLVIQHKQVSLQVP